MCLSFTQKQVRTFFWYISIFGVVTNGFSQYISKDNVDKVCGKLYSGKNLDGESFTLTDFDLSGNLKRDFRSSVSGWNFTRSIRVETNCTMTVYSETFFRRVSGTFGPGDYTNLVINPSSIKCVCTGDCRCNDIHLPKLEYGRAYVNCNCNTCNTRYIQLGNNGEILEFPAVYRNSARSILLRSGCNLTIYSHKSSTTPTRVILTKLVEEFQGVIGSYSMDCDDSAYITQPRAYPEAIELPETEHKIFDLLATNATLIDHPGMQVTLKSIEHGRSSRNGYILLLGASDPEHIGFEKCSRIRLGIRECHIAVKLDELGITAQLRLIYAGRMQFSNSKHYDYLVSASLDQYLASHKDLQSKIPNAVIIYTSLLSIGISEFRELKAFNALLYQRQLVDQTHSNVVFLVNGVRDKYPEEKIRQLETVVNTRLNFPKPLIVIANTRFSRTEAEAKVNGYRKMTSGEYWPKNIQDALMLVAEKGNDPLGYAIFKEAFKEGNRQNVVNVTENFEQPLNADDDTLELYEVLAKSVGKPESDGEPFLERMARFKTQIDQKIAQATGRTIVTKPSEVTTEVMVPQATTSDEIPSQLPCERHQWRSIANLTKSDKLKMLDFGFVDLRGHRMFPCRAVVGNRGVLRVGSFTFEEGVCRVWYKKGVVREAVNAEVLIVPVCHQHNVGINSPGNSFRYQYSFIRQQNVTETDSVTAIFAGNSKPKNLDKYIAFGSYSVKTDCGLRTVDMIGTACLNNCLPDNKIRGAVFAGVTKAFETSNFKVLVCTRTKA